MAYRGRYTHRKKMSTYWSLIHMSAPHSVRRPRRPAAIRTSFRIFAWASSETSGVSAASSTSFVSCDVFLSRKFPWGDCIFFWIASFAARLCSMDLMPHSASALSLAFSTRA